MIQDIFVPSKIGSYYLFEKKVLGFEITTSSVQASLIYFSKSKIFIENSMIIPLQDQNPASIINAIKKITTTIGKYNEVATSLTSSAVIFKELTLPFIGREKIAMIVHYEVEPLLPFSLDEAVIDFLITEENKEKLQTTILVAAARKSDLEIHTSYFDKAGVVLTHVTLDMFALYDFYRHTMHVVQTYTSLLLIDFGVDAIRILYVQKGVLKSVRLVPYGLLSMLHKIDESFQLLSNKSMTDLFDKILDGHDDAKEQVAHKLIIDFCKQVSLSIAFFQKQIKNFTMPTRVICLGQGSQLEGFLDQATEICQINFEKLDIKRIALKNNIQANKKIKFDLQHASSLIVSLSAVHYGQINFLSYEQKKLYNDVLNKQLLTGFILSCLILVGLYFYSNYQVKIWNTAYEKSRKELVATLKQQMEVEVKNIKRVSDIVSSAQSKLEQTKKVCISFSQSHNAFLYYLQLLCSKIDRISLGLDLKKLSLQDKEIILQGKVRDYDVLQTFEEELMDLDEFILKERPKELVFTVTLQVKEDQDK